MKLIAFSFTLLLVSNTLFPEDQCSMEWINQTASMEICPIEDSLVAKIANFESMIPEKERTDAYIILGISLPIIIFCSIYLLAKNFYNRKIATDPAGFGDILRKEGKAHLIPPQLDIDHYVYNTYPNVPSAPGKRSALTVFYDSGYDPRYDIALPSVARQEYWKN